MPKKRPEPPNLTTELLRQIRDGVENTRTELVAAIGETNDRLDTLNGRVDALTLRVDAIGTRMTATEMRLGTQHAEILVALEKLRASIADAMTRDAAINDLDERVTALEKTARQ